MALKFNPNGFLDIASDHSELPSEYQGKDEVSGSMRRCTNLHLDKLGIASTRKGSSKINTSATAQTDPHLLVELAGNRYLFSGTEIYQDEVSIESGLSDAEWSAIKYNQYNSLYNAIFALNGYDYKKIIGTDVFSWGIAVPSTALITSAGARTGLTGTYNAKYTYARKEGDAVVCESNPSDAGDDQTLTNDSLIIKCEMPTDEQVTHLRIYRTDTSGVYYYHLCDIPVNPDNDYAYTYDWELEDAYISGTGEKITTLCEVPDSVEIFDCDYPGSPIVAQYYNNYICGAYATYKDFGVEESKTGLAIFTKKTGYWDLSEQTYIEVWLRSSTTKPGNFYFYFGETTYNEQTSPAQTYSGSGWKAHRWDISAIAAASRDQITKFGISYQNTKTSHDLFDYDDIYGISSGYAYDYMQKLYSWEVDDTIDYEYYIITAQWEPIIMNTVVADTSLGTEVATDHDLPPTGTFVFGPTFTGLTFILKGNLLYYSLEKQPEYFPTNYFLEVMALHRSLISGCIWDSQVYVADESEIYLIAGSGHSSWSPPLAQSVICGTVAKKCFLALHGYGIFHLGRDGVYLYYDGDKNITEERFKPIFEGETVGSIPGINQDAIENCWLKYYKSKLYFGYPAGSSTYPDNIIVVNLATGKAVHYDYSQTFRAIEIDETNDRLLACDTSGYIWRIEDPDVTDDDGTPISFDIESKAFTDQLYKYFPRYARYDVNLEIDATATGSIMLDGVSKQSHTLSVSRQTKQRLVTGCNGDRLSLRINGTGVVDIYTAEAG